MKQLLQFSLLLFSISLFAQTGTRIIISVKQGYSSTIATEKQLTGVAAIDTVNRKYNPVEAQKLNMGKSRETVFVVTFPDGTNSRQIIKDLQNSPAVEYAEPDAVGTGGGIMACMSAPNDTFYSRQWSLKNNGTFNLMPATAGADIDMENAWDIQQGSSNVVVAIMDSGMKMDHPEVAGRLWVNPGEIANNNIDDDANGYIDDVNGWDFVNNDKTPADDLGHGTNIAGIIAANGNNGIGYSGIDRACKLMTLKGLNSANSGFYTWWNDAIRYAADNGADVINLSVGGNGASALLQGAVNYALANGVVVIACMMNFNNSVSYFPASYIGVIAVGSTNPNDTRSAPFFWSNTSGSNFGSHISVVAPGNYIYGLSHLSNTDYSSYWGGTSQATPMVVGLASLLLAQNPSLTAAQIKTLIQDTAEDQVGNSQDTAGFDIYYGHGRINAYNALATLANPAFNANTNKLVVYPNPSQGAFTAELTTYPADVSVYNTLGQLVLQKTISDADNTIRLTGAGIYMVTAKAGNAVSTKKIIIE